MAELKGYTFYIFLSFLILWILYFLSLAVTTSGLKFEKDLSIRRFLKVFLTEIILCLNIARYSLYRWFFHLMLMWTFIFFFTFYFFPETASILVKGRWLFLHDIFSLLFLFSILMLFLRRLRRKPGFPSEYEDYLSLLILLFILLSGILLSSVKYRYSNNFFLHNFFPERWLLLFQGSYSRLFLLHIISVWLFLFLFPLTKLRHIFTSPLNIILSFMEKGKRSDIYERWIRIPQIKPQKKY